MAKISEEQNKEDLEDKIQIFSNTDEKLKSLGKMLNNDSSMEILQLLIEKEMTSNEIATRTKLSLPLALYHVNQMIEARIAVVNKTSTNGKNQPMKHYSAKPGIIILPEKASQKAKQSKSFSNSLKRLLKFTVIGVVGLGTWFSTRLLQNQKNILDNGSQNWNPEQISIDWFLFDNELWLPILLVLITVVGSYFLFKLKEKKKRG